MVRIKKVQIPELPVKKPRRLYIWLPQKYFKSEQYYPVLYMFDGHNVFYDSHASYGKSWGMKEYLNRSRLPLIIAAIECNHEGERRMNEYAPWDYDDSELGSMEGQGKLTMDWITGPLKQYIDSTYRTLPDRDNTLIAGSSMGGLMSLYAVTAYNDVFSRAAALSPSFCFGGEHLHQLFSDTPLQEPTRIYMDTGTCEFDPDERGQIAELFESAAELTCSGADVAARVVPGACHCEAAWEKRIPLFMNYLLYEEACQ